MGETIAAYVQVAKVVWGVNDSELNNNMYVYSILSQEIA
jgi:hypothetical protein